jgi:DNA-binding GntR family transcriptional regulator
MYQIRAQLSILAIEFAYPKINDSIIQELKSINEKFHAANQRKDRLKATEYDGQFHNVFLQLADNHFLTEFIEVLRIHIQRFQMASDPYVSLIAKGDSSYDEHSAVIKALEQKDLEGAKTAMMTNWLHTIDVASHRQ